MFVWYIKNEKAIQSSTNDNNIQLPSSEQRTNLISTPVTEKRCVGDPSAGASSNLDVASDSSFKKPKLDLLAEKSSNVVQQKRFDETASKLTSDISAKLKLLDANDFLEHQRKTFAAVESMNNELDIMGAQLAELSADLSVNTVKALTLLAPENEYAFLNRLKACAQICDSNRQVPMKM
eukprot:Nk52_evm3s162 gene=Nk52_evmTU3s162